MDIEVIEEIRLSWLGYLKRMGSYRIPKVILFLNTEGWRRKEGPRKQWMDEVRRA